MTLNDKNTWRRSWLDSIYKLTSYELQKKKWMDINNTNPHFSFIEFMCWYFDDLLADISYQEYIKMGWVGDVEYQVIEQWHLSLDKYQSPGKNDFDQIAILNDPLWKEIVKLGESSRLKLKGFLSVEESEVLSGVMESGS